MLKQLRTLFGPTKTNIPFGEVRAQARLHKELGNAALGRGDQGAAERHYRDAIDADPTYDEAYNNLGTVLAKTERFGEAVEYYLRAISLNPKYALAYLNLGNWHKDHGNIEDQISAYEKAVAVKPDYYEAYNNLGSVLRQQERIDEAITCFEKALAINPDLALAHLNLGLCYRAKRDMQREMDCFRKAIEIAPDYWDAHCLLGFALLTACELDQAERHFRMVLEATPAEPQNRFNLASLLLMRGKYQEGLELYESRFAFFHIANPEIDPDFFTDTLQTATWKGENLEGKSILVWMEQGLGDNLMMMRFLPQLAAHNPRRLVILSRAQLSRLFEHVPYKIEVMDYDAALHPGVFDYHIALTSLPYMLGTNLETIPTDTPFFQVPETMRKRWQERISSLSGLKVRLVWAGNSKTGRDFLRSMSFSHLALLAGTPGCSFISLQKGELTTDAEQARWLAHDCIKECNDFLDTAALVENLDLVISVDTSVAHLAGCLGKPVWMLCRYESEWRWMLDREDSPWYPSMRIFRQTAVDDWAGVIERVGQELQRLALQQTALQEAVVN